jgi:hypothetical protein
VEGSMTIRETAGIGGTITSITLTAFNPQVVFPSGYIVQVSGTNRVTAHGVLVVPLNVGYGLVENLTASRQLLMPFVVQFTDDHCNQVSGVVTWTVT